MAPQELIDGKAYAVVYLPYLATAVASLVPIECRAITTLAVDKFWRLYYNPEYLQGKPPREVATMIVHEVLHLLREHHQRLNTVDQTIANVAADLEINDDLDEMPLSLPDGALLPAMFGLDPHLSAEEYLDRLQSQRQERSSPSGSQSSAGSSKDSRSRSRGSGSRQQHGSRDSKGGAAGDDGGTASDQSGGQSGGTSSNGSGAQNGSQWTTSPTAGNCGSCAQGRQMPWELGEPGDSQPGISPEQAELIRAATAAAIREYKSQGRVPAGLERWAESLLKPTVNWKRRLQAAVRQQLAWATGAVDYTYHRPSRRQSALPHVVLPTLRKPQPEVAVIVDTSGSMSERELSQAIAEVAAILRSVRHVTVLSVDSAVHLVRKVFRPDQIRLVGGGGTSMAAGLERAAQLKPAPAVTVVITDGYTDWPDHKPKGLKRVIVALTNNSPDSVPSNSPDSVPSWAEKVLIGDDH